MLIRSILQAVAASHGQVAEAGRPEVELHTAQANGEIIRRPALDKQAWLTDPAWPRPDSQANGGESHMCDWSLTKK